jgi:chlorobactene glucosyltransferase
MGGGHPEQEGGMNIFSHPQALLVIIFLSLSLVTAICNTFYVRRFDQFPQAAEFPRLSVLVPARNEIRNIEACVVSLLSQDYPDFEVLVLDDQSTDETLQVLRRLEAGNSRLRVMEGRPLPEGWLGKHWACQQLSQQANGELLLFTDADTRHAPNMLRDSVSALLNRNADLVTAFPREETHTWLEQLVVPVISFGIFSFLPIYLVRFLGLTSLSVTIGQFMLFRREAYESIGGYEAVRDKVVDDVSLGRRILQQGYEWRLLDGTRHFTCRMYHNFSEIVEGFGKNAFAFFDYRILPFFLTLALLALAFIEPVLALINLRLGLPVTLFTKALARLAVFESLLLWGIAYRRFKIPLYLTLLYPLSMALIILIGLRSFMLTMTGNATWKDRTLERAAVRWL